MQFTATGQPAYQDLRAQYPPAPKPKRMNGRLLGLLMMAIGVAGWWYNWHLATTDGQFYVKLCILGPLGVFGGILVFLRPDWAGPMGKDSSRAHKLALCGVIGLMAIASGADMYLLNQRTATRSTIIPWSPDMGIPSVAAAPSPAVAPSIAFLQKTYRLGSFHERPNPTWEFVPEGESIHDWKTLLTVIDRPDARTREELDRLAEGIMSTYKSHGARVLAAKTMQEASGAVFNYMVVAFEEPANQRYELNFVRIELGPRNAVVVVYGARVTDPRDYRAKAKEFLDRNSGEVGRALGTLVLPDLRQLPRRVF